MGIAFDPGAPFTHRSAEGIHILYTSAWNSCRNKVKCCALRLWTTLSPEDSESMLKLQQLSVFEDSIEKNGILWDSKGQFHQSVSLESWFTGDFQIRVSFKLLFSEWRLFYWVCRVKFVSLIHKRLDPPEWKFSHFLLYKVQIPVISWQEQIPVTS